MTGEMLVIALFKLYKINKNTKYNVNGMEECYNEMREKTKFV